MAMFHGYDYLEREKLDISGEDFPAYWKSIEVSLLKKRLLVLRDVTLVWFMTSRSCAS